MGAAADGLQPQDSTQTAAWSLSSKESKVEDRPGWGWNASVFDLPPNEVALHANTLAVNEIVGSLVYRALGKPY